MISGIGVDTVDVCRFNQWCEYSYTRLSRIFSTQEIDYCLSSHALSAQRFAVRFAAREAFFKALSSAYPDHTVPFLTVCRKSRIIKENGRPIFIFDWSCIHQLLYDKIFPTVHVSLTHTQTSATVFVIIERRLQ